MNKKRGLLAPCHFNGVQGLQASRAKLAFFAERWEPFVRGKDWKLASHYDPLKYDGDHLIAVAKQHCVDAIMATSQGKVEEAFVHTFLAWKMSVVGLVWIRYRAPWRKEKRFFRRERNRVDEWLDGEWTVNSPSVVDNHSIIQIECEDEDHTLNILPSEEGLEDDEAHDDEA